MYRNIRPLLYPLNETTASQTLYSALWFCPCLNKDGPCMSHSTRGWRDWRSGSYNYRIFLKNDQQNLSYRLAFRMGDSADGLFRPACYLRGQSPGYLDKERTLSIKSLKNKSKSNSSTEGASCYHCYFIKMWTVRRLLLLFLCTANNLKP